MSAMAGNGKNILNSLLLWEQRVNDPGEWYMYVTSRVLALQCIFYEYS